MNIFHSTEEVEKLLAQKEEVTLVRHQTDRLLRLQASICANTGMDSTKKEKVQAKAKIKKLDRFIKRIDPDFFEKIKRAED